MEQNTESSQPVTKEDLWYIGNYILLRDYYDRTISRIAARCIRMGNIALEEYPFYNYILDILEEICDTGEYIIARPQLYPYVAKKIAGGIDALKKNLELYQKELLNNQAPEKLKQDPQEINKMKEALGGFEKADDPTAGAGMNIDALMEKLMAQNKKEEADQPNPDGENKGENQNA